MPPVVWSRLDPLTELREAFEDHPNLTLETRRFRDAYGVLTRIWWCDALGERGAIAEVKEHELIPLTTRLLDELDKLRRGKAKGAGA